MEEKENGIKSVGPSKPEPQPIPGYQVLSKIASGGTALVFKAKDIKNNRLVALKILYPKTVENKTLLASFIKEAKLLIKFNHPNIVKGYNAGTFNQLYFLAMEYIEGKSVGELLKERGKLKEDLAIDIILQTAQALDYMQNQGIIHRDIKPDNLLYLDVTRILKLCDLGFAQQMDAGHRSSSETTCGTPQYMSPEQAKGQSDLDVRSDIYSLGATLYHLVTGETPFKGSDNLEIMAKQVLDELQSGAIKNSRFSPLTLYFIEKMMAKEKEIRYQNAREVIEDIQTELSGFKSLEFNPE
jgi:serine/threonine-protein kinase